MKSEQEIRKYIAELREKETHTLITDDDYGLYDKLADQLEWLFEEENNCLNCFCFAPDTKLCFWTKQQIVNPKTHLCDRFMELEEEE